MSPCQRNDAIPVGELLVRLKERLADDCIVQGRMEAHRVVAVAHSEETSEMICNTNNTK